MPINQTNRIELLERIDASWNALILKLESFSQDEMHIPDVVGIWSLKDLIGHLETWDHIALTKIHYAEQGDSRSWFEIEEQPFDSIDAFNEHSASQKRDTSLEMLWKELYDRHRLLRDRVRLSDAVSDDLIREDTWAHYDGHLNDIRRWETRHTETQRIID
jgi:uncharacterized damage-inducible protein DinB